MPPSVLLVEDDDEVREIFRRVLEKLWDLDILEATNGNEALLLAMRHKPDLVITDVYMPGMDGPRLLEALKDRYPDLPVVGMSGTVGAADSAGSKFDAFLEKPFHVEDLRRMVGPLLGHRRD